MGFLKAFGRSFAGLFVLLGLTVFIISYFGVYALNNFNILENDLNNLGININQIEQYCSENPQDENCQNPLFKGIKREIDEFKYYGSAMKGIGFVFFVIGFLLFVWCSGWVNGLRQTSLISFIGVAFSYLYYRFALVGALNSFLSQEILGMVNNWVTITLNKTLNLILILGVTFLILTVALYILHYRKKKGKILNNEPRR